MLLTKRTLPNIVTTERQRRMQRCTFGDTPCQDRDHICTPHTRRKYNGKSMITRGKEEWSKRPSPRLKPSPSGRGQRHRSAS